MSTGGGCKVCKKSTLAKCTAQNSESSGDTTLRLWELNPCILIVVRGSGGDDVIILTKYSNIYACGVLRDRCVEQWPGARNAEKNPTVIPELHLNMVGKITLADMMMVLKLCVFKHYRAAYKANSTPPSCDDRTSEGIGLPKFWIRWLNETPYQKMEEFVGGTLSKGKNFSELLGLEWLGKIITYWIRSGVRLGYSTVLKRSGGDRKYARSMIKFAKTHGV